MNLTNQKKNQNKIVFPEKIRYLNFMGCNLGKTNILCKESEIDLGIDLSEIEINGSIEVLDSIFYKSSRLRILNSITSKNLYINNLSMQKDCAISVSGEYMKGVSILDIAAPSTSSSLTIDHLKAPSIVLDSIATREFSLDSGNLKRYEHNNSDIRHFHLNYNEIQDVHINNCNLKDFRIYDSKIKNLYLNSVSIDSIMMCGNNISKVYLNNSTILKNEPDICETNELPLNFLKSLPDWC